jgi:hypothetical protein
MMTRTLEEIEIRQAEVQSQLDMINEQLQEELAKPFMKRCWFRCQVLDLNKKLCNESLKQLNWVLHA